MHRVGLRDLGQRFPGSPSLECLGSLVRVSFGFRPNFTPFVIARVRPSDVRAFISRRSNWATAARIVNANSPFGLVVSTSGSPRLLKFAPAFRMSSINLSRSWVEGRAGESVDLRHDDYIALLERRHHFHELLPVRAGAADLLGVVWPR